MKPSQLYLFLYNVVQVLGLAFFCLFLFLKLILLAYLLFLDGGIFYF